MLLPAKAEVSRQLRRYRAWERMTLAAPADLSLRATFEDSGYTLCVLMGERCAREAADAAERYLRASMIDEVRDRSRPAGRGAEVMERVAADRMAPVGSVAPAGAVV
ncbi:DUF5133 domain-containing protein [Streptomyces ziwulingensis]|uniref:DUF5133 domain-containing protein n=1 Tax=Streptomyces ziwulingensis TaxID=1045501 RepID=A0ABP9D2M5_9ACTN